MADTSIAITAGAGNEIDTRTEATNGHHRQVIVLGDPSTNAGVAPVSASLGLAVEVKQIAAGTNNIGDVDILSIAAGDNNIGNVDIVSLPALAAGTNAIGKLAANTGVDIGDVDVTSIVPGTGATNLGKAEDAAHTSGDVGIMPLGVRINPASIPVFAGTDGDYSAFAINANGAPLVSLDQRVQVNGDSYGLLRLEDDALADNSAGVPILLRRLDTPAGPSTNGDCTWFIADANSKLWCNVQLHSATTGGHTIYRSLDLDETGVSIKGSAGQVFGWYICNQAAAARYVKLYNKATAATVGTDTPVMTLVIPAYGACNVEYANGITFSLGISAGATTALADASTAAPTANDVVFNLFYK